MLFLLTAVEHVAINFGTPEQIDLEEMSADEAERYADQGQFGKGSMEPKVRAAAPAWLHPLAPPAAFRRNCSAGACCRPLQ